jgi:glycerol-3-phosphate dehydrogenase
LVRAIRGEERLWALEAAHAIEETMCLSVGDFLLRRTPLVLSRPDHGRKFAGPAVRAVFKELLSHSEASFDDYLRQELAWRQPR